MSVRTGEESGLKKGSGTQFHRGGSGKIKAEEEWETVTKNAS